MKTILVPTDFSSPALWAIEVAGVIARKTNAQVVLLHIIENDSSESFNAEAEVGRESELWEGRIFVNKLIARRKEQLSEVAATLSDIHVRQELRLGNPFHGIRKMITDHQADLIVMGTSGDAKWEEEMWVGSNAVKVIRTAHCPVLTVQNQWTSRNFDNIVYASSLSKREKEFPSVIKKIQEIFGSRIHLLRVNTPMNFQSDHATLQALSDFASQHQLENCTLHVYSAFSEEEGIRYFSASVNADLIAMATHGRTGVARLLASSIAEEVVHHAQLPTLTSVIRD
ncbi:MAG: universal stress protein [Cytophaga sp.]|nr:universal stress protein [Cytophaga sp.]